MNFSQICLLTLALAGASCPAHAADVDAATLLARTGSLSVSVAGRAHSDGYVRRSTFRDAVERILGTPSAVLTDGTLLYRNYHPLHQDVKGTLVVRFDGSRVSDLTLVSGSVDQLVRQPNPGQNRNSQAVAAR